MAVENTASLRSPVSAESSRLDDRIRVSGSVVIGTEITRKQLRSRAVAAAQENENEFRRSGIDPNSHSARAAANGGGSGIGEALEDELDGANLKPVRIAGDGFTSSYGIFGSPGTGKTVLIMRLLSEILGTVPDRDSPSFEDLKFGALVLDPKAALIDKVSRMMAQVGRSDDLIILNTDEMIARNLAVNVIDASISPRELGRFLVLAAQSAGIAASEPFWFIAWSNLFGAAITLLEFSNEGRTVTLRRLIEALMLPARGRRGIEAIAERASQTAGALITANYPLIPPGSPRHQELKSNLERAADEVLAYFDRTIPETSRRIGIIDSFISRAYGAFLEQRYACFSEASCAAARRSGIDGQTSSFYDAIIEKGKVVLISISPSEPEFAKRLCTLVKCLFQQAVMSRKERARRDEFAPGKLFNFRRPVLLACDEYSEVATELPGQPMGDGHFFALARENGCMGLLATQSVNVLENSSLRGSWRSVFSNFAAKFFMGASDNETVEEACKLAGDEDWEIVSTGETQSLEGQSYSTSRELRERKSLPGRILTRTLQLGEAVIIGSLDGRASRPNLQMVRIPGPPDSGDGAKG